MISLINIGVREIEDDRTKQFCFELFPLAGEKMKSSKPTSNEAGKMTEGKAISFFRTKIQFSCIRSSCSLSNVSNNRR
jgi:hypothetical protein